MGRGKRGKRFRKTVAGLPTARFRDRLAHMCASAGLRVIAVDPAYTSRWGAQHWQRPISTKGSGAGSQRSASPSSWLPRSPPSRMRIDAPTPLKSAGSGPRCGATAAGTRPPERRDLNGRPPLRARGLSLPVFSAPSKRAQREVARDLESRGRCPRTVLPSGATCLNRCSATSVSRG